MAWNLTNDLTIPPGKRIVAGKPSIDDDAGEMTVPLELRTSQAAGDFLLSRKVVTVRNGACDRVAAVTPPDGSNIEERLTYQRGAVTVANGFTRALAAWAGGGATASGKRNALVAELAAIGVIDTSSLAGS